MTGRHADSLRVDDVSLTDRAVACHAQITAYFAKRAAAPVQQDNWSAWRATHEALIEALMILERAQAILAEVVTDCG